MFEDTNFISVDFVENNDDINQYEELDYIDNETIQPVATDIPSKITIPSDDVTIENLNKDEVIENTQEIINEKTDIIENKAPTEVLTLEKTKSTGVSTYTEVPDIKKETVNCDNTLISTIDQINLLTVFISIFAILLFFKKRKFTKPAEKITNIIKRFSFLINVVLLSISFLLFNYPSIMGTGISGKIDVFTMFEFASLIILNGFVITFIIIKKLKEKKFILKDKKYSFSGIIFLQKSLITFSITALLFFFLTESRIALTILYLFSIFTSIFFFIKEKFETLQTYIPFMLFGTILQFGIIGMLSNIYIFVISSSIFLAYYYNDVKTLIDETKKVA